VAVKEAIGPSIPAGYRGNLRLGDEQYLWILVGIEVAILAWGRYATRRLHGG
jgi:hypothetical protein